MRIPEILTENPISRVTKKQVKQHPYLTTTVLAGLVFGGTWYDSAVHVDPIQQRAMQEAYAICNYPTAEELIFARDLASNANPIDRQRANQIDARVHGCSATATVLVNRALSNNGRPMYALELLASGISGATLVVVGVLGFLNRRRQTPQTTAC